MATPAPTATDLTTAFAVENRSGRGAFVIACDHASRHVPPPYAGLGLPASELRGHIAWDIGALGVSARLSALLDTPLLHPTVSRLLLDVNRDPSAHDSIARISEDTVIPGNADLDAAERRHRHDWIYAPYHTELKRLIDRRLAARAPTALIAMHSFTPVFKGVPRPWAIGVLSQRDRRLADPLLHALRAQGAGEIGDNQPYAPRDGVYHTLQRHAETRGLPCVMIEIRNDLIRDSPGQQAWAERLAPLLARALEDAAVAKGAAVHR